MKLHIHCTSCLSPNTSVQVAIDNYNLRLQQTKSSLNQLISLPKNIEITISISDISSTKDTIMLSKYCEHTLPRDFKTIPLPLSLSRETQLECSYRGKGYSEILMLRELSNYISNLPPSSKPDKLIKVGARTIPSNISYLSSLLFLFKKYPYHVFSNRKYRICETRCFALSPDTLDQFLDSVYPRQINDSKNLYIEHALYKFLKHYHSPTIPCPFIPIYKSMHEASTGTLMRDGYLKRILSFFLFSYII